MDRGFVFHNPGLPDVTTFADARRVVADFNNAFPDARSTIEDIVAEGDKVVCRYLTNMTHEHDYMGIPATGKQVTLSEIAIYRIFGSKIREEWHCADALGLMRQPGVLSN